MTKIIWRTITELELKQFKIKNDNRIKTKTKEVERNRNESKCSKVWKIYNTYAISLSLTWKIIVILCLCLSRTKHSWMLYSFLYSVQSNVSFIATWSSSFVPHNCSILLSTQEKHQIQFKLIWRNTRSWADEEFSNWSPLSAAAWKRVLAISDDCLRSGLCASARGIHGMHLLCCWSVIFRSTW